MLSEKKAFESAIAQLEKELGKNCVMHLEEKINPNVECVSTGSLSINEAIGYNGIPLGRIIEIYGPESSGKTTLAMHIISEAQKKDMKCVFIDMEHAFDIKYAKSLGINTKNLCFSQPDNGEDALIIVEKLIASGGVKIVVIDSVASLITKSELEGDISDVQMGGQAKLMSKALRKLVPLCNLNQCSIIFINQLRQKIGVIFGSPEVTTGGKALAYYSTLRIDIRRSTPIIGEKGPQKGKTIGNKTKVKIVKNKLSAPFQTAEFDIFYGKGICKIGEIIDYAVQNNIIDKSGAWYSYKNEKICQGRENVKSYLTENKNKFEEISIEVKNLFSANNESFSSDKN